MDFDYPPTVCMWRFCHLHVPQGLVLVPLKPWRSDPAWEARSSLDYYSFFKYLCCISHQFFLLWIRVSMTSLSWLQSSILCPLLIWNLQYLLLPTSEFSFNCLGNSIPSYLNSTLKESWNMISLKVYREVYLEHLPKSYRPSHRSPYWWSPPRRLSNSNLSSLFCFSYWYYFFLILCVVSSHG